LDNFEWPYLHNSSRPSAHRAVIFAIAQLSCYVSLPLLIKSLHINACKLLSSVTLHVHAMRSYQSDHIRSKWKPRPAPKHC